MTREETKAAIAVMQAYADGKEIERETMMGEWHNEIPSWNWGCYMYRIKPQPEPTELEQLMEEVMALKAQVIELSMRSIYRKEVLNPWKFQPPYFGPITT